jgi:CheY-like chemotaxis protein
LNYKDLHILIVEDNKVNQLLVISTLQKFGFLNVNSAEDGSIALKKIAENNYDIILLDIQMPGLDGYEIAREIRRNKKLHHQDKPIIAISGGNSEEDKLKAKEAGISDYVIKPYTPEDFYSILLKHINNPFGEPVVEEQERQEKISDAETENPGMDLSFLDKYTGEDSTITIQLLEIFLHEVPGAVEKMSHFIHEKKWKDVQAVSHKVKSSLAIFELYDLRQLAADIEEHSREQTNPDKVQQLFIEFSSGCMKVIPRLKEELRKIKEAANL